VKGPAVLRGGDGCECRIELGCRVHTGSMMPASRCREPPGRVRGAGAAGRGYGRVAVADEVQGVGVGMASAQDRASPQQKCPHTPGLLTNGLTQGPASLQH
jgi:hypothetical protein